jgi:hypothetical protein
MARGDLARAVKYTGGIDPVVASIQDIFNKKALNDYYTNILGAYNKSSEQIKNLSGDEKPAKAIKNNLNPLVLQGQQPAVQQQKNPLSAWNYNTAKDITNNFTVQQLTGAMKTPGADPTIVNALSGLLGTEAQKYKPEPESMSPPEERKVVEGKTKPVITTINEMKGGKYYTKDRIKTKYPNIYTTHFEGDNPSKEEGLYITHVKKTADNPEGIEASSGEELLDQTQKKKVTKIPGRPKRKPKQEESAIK